MDEFLEDQKRGLAELAKNYRKSRIAAARQAAQEAAVRIKSLNVKVRSLARSGFRLTNISHSTVQKLIELQAEIVNSALTEAAARIERLAQTASVQDLARDQADVLKATRRRIVDDLSRALAILRESGEEIRAVTASRTKAARPRPATRAAKPAAKVARRAGATAARRPKAARKARGKPKAGARKSARRVRATRR
jgi:phasin family protein